MTEDQDESEEDLISIGELEATSFSVFDYQDPSLASGVLKAVVTSDLEYVKRLVESGKSVNINDNLGNTPLHVAAFRNNLEIVTFLLTRDDLCVNAQNFLGETPLLMGAQAGSYNIVKKLIEAKADVNISSHDASTPLHLSVAFPDVTHLLIQNKADIDAYNCNDNTPLHSAIVEENLETCCMLLYYNADANAPGSMGFTPFMNALRVEDVAIQTALLDYVDDFNAENSDGFTALFLALTSKTPYLEEILNRGAQITDLEFEALLQQHDISKFQILWSRLEIIETPPALLYMLNQLNPENFILHIKVIMNNEIALKDMIEKFDLFNFLNLFRYRDLEDMLTEFTFAFLMNGYELNVNDVEGMYKCFGYSNLFKMLRYIPCIQPSRLNLLIPRKIFFITEPLVSLMAFQAHLRLYQANRRDVETFFKYSRATIQALNYTSRRKSRRVQMEGGLMSVPTLVDISREPCREHIIDKFNIKSACQYFTVIDHMDISSTYKKLLKYDSQLY